MSRFRRNTPDETEVVGVPASPGRPTSQLCSEPGCGGPDRVTCDYRDRRGTPCPTAWCPEHIVKVNAWHLCRRHAGIVQSLAPVEFRGELPPPDLDNRAPSLAAYLAGVLDEPMRKLLTELARPALGEYVAAEALNLVTSVGGDRRWSQGWKLFDNTGPLLRIGVEVDEKRDPECCFRLNSRIVLRFIPPWIRERKAGPPFSPEEETERRRVFFETLMEQHVRPAVVAEERWTRRWERSPQAGIRS